MCIMCSKYEMIMVRVSMRRKAWPKTNKGKEWVHSRKKAAPEFHHTIFTFFCFIYLVQVVVVSFNLHCRFGSLVN